MSEAKQEEQKKKTLMSFLTITGPLPGGRYLTYPLKVKIAYDDGEVIVSEPHFHIHAAGTTMATALAEFKLILTEELDDLTVDEEELGPRLQAELRYLRNLIRTA
jgi:hypothetical protein